jgi:hypothetical protein
MLYRLLSALGAVAHLPDAAMSKLFRRHIPWAAPTAGAARIAMPMILGSVLALLFIAAVATWTESAANPYPADYTVSGLASSPDLHGRIWARISGDLHPRYVEYEDFSGDYDHSDYLRCESEGRECLVVLSHRRDDEISAEAGFDMSVTFTGMLRADPDEVNSLLDTPGGNLSGLDINRTYILVEGQAPGDARAMAALAIVSGGLGAPLLIGWMIGYVVFRPSRQQPQPGAGMAGPLPVRVTGLLVGPGGGVRAREMRAELRPGEIHPDAAAAGWAPPVDLWWISGHDFTVVRLTPTITAGVAGTAYPFAGARPALRARFGGFKLIFEFDDEAARDAAYAQLQRSALYSSPMPAAPYWPGYGAPPQYGAPPLYGVPSPYGAPPAAPGDDDPGTAPPRS